MTSLSIVIPALNADASLDAVLAHLRANGAEADEIVIADGGSAGGSAALAARYGARLVTAARGRGTQLRAGAEAAGGDWLLFLHADTVPGEGWREAVREFMAAESNRRRAAAFRFALADDDPRARRLERLVAWRCRVLGLPYGDQGLLLSRALYDDLGGYPPIPLMEDVALVRKIGRRRITLFDVPAVTAAARYRRGGYVARPARNLLCLGLYFLGLPPRWIARLYA